MLCALCVYVCVCVRVSMTSPKSCHRAQFLLYRLFHSTELFDLPDDAIATAAACFVKSLRAGGGVVFNVKWRRYNKDKESDKINWIDMIDNRKYYEREQIGEIK